jgi:NTP pyrophosphatase (non-canonical NTP hydrolase)
MNDFDRYQSSANATAIYPQRGRNLTYPTLGLAGESGEVAEKVKKILRDNDGILTDDVRVQLVKELGDVLWYCSQIAYEIGVPLSMVAELNITKLRHRFIRGRMHGSGDDR